MENTVTDTVIGSLVAFDTGVDQQMTFAISANEGQAPVKVGDNTECINEVIYVKYSVGKAFISQ